MMGRRMKIKDQGNDGCVVLDRNGNLYARTYSAADAYVIAQAPAMLEIIVELVSSLAMVDNDEPMMQKARAILRAVERDR